MNFGHRSLFGCHVAVGDVAPGFCVRYVSGGEVSLLTSARRCLCPFVDPGLVRVCFGGFAVIWAVVFVRGQSWVVGSLTSVGGGGGGHSLPFIDGGGHALVLRVWWWLLVEGRSSHYVTMASRSNSPMTTFAVSLQMLWSPVGLCLN